MWEAFYITGVAATLVGGVFYSIAARRRDQHPLLSRMTLGKMNISLGILLLLFGINQFTFDSLTTVRVIVGVIFALVGGYNFFQGMRNYFYYRREWNVLQKQQG